ncbi:DUF5681 domain-containing protein [Rhizobium rhizogenes]|jgi:hypothetical protein|uniref:DUF5681 domain-containing protein n=1 Tax=Rhizobium rhizogenes TaxID=359 RepID=UPI003ED10EF5
MTETSQPEWMSGFEPKSLKWSRGMKSPNPAGRPKGIIDKRQKVTETLRDDAPAVVRVVVDAALAGDMQAAGLVLSRIAPTLRSQSEKVTFDFDANLPISRQIEAVLAGIASGAVSPDVGKSIIEAIGTLSSARAVEELETRLTILEAKQI